MPGSSTQPITLLLTAVEDAAPGARDAPAALARTEALLREALAGAGGTIFAAADGLAATFPTAGAAMRAAVAAGAAMRAEGWESPDLLRVRLALHTGPAPGGPPTELVVARAAALLAAAHPGQILLSAAAAAAARPVLPRGLTLRDLGERRLRDLLAREHIYQALAPDLPAIFLPLRTLESYPNNLSPQVYPLIGRAGEEAACRRLLRRPSLRLLTLVGTAGAGKTRLAIHIAAAALPDFPAGAWFVPLGPIQEASLVPAVIAAALGVKEGAGASVRDRLVDRLRAQRLLLVLDNFEQVRGAADLLAELLAASPGLTILVTSRTPLHLPGEAVFAVPPLAVPSLAPAGLGATAMSPAALAHIPAVALFVARAAEVEQGFVLTAENAAAIAAICVQLDGLPLAIELAAVRTRQLTPAAILKRLTDPAGYGALPLLTSGAPHLPARQQTLRGAISWSYALLDPTAQRLFARLAVFVGGFTLDAAERVTREESGVGSQESADSTHGLSLVTRHPTRRTRRVSSLATRHCLAALGEASLLREDVVDGKPRWRMLGTIREYALEQLEESGEGPAVRRRHAAYFLTLAEEAGPHLAGPDQVAWLACLEGEHANLRAALAWCRDDPASGAAGLRLATALWRFWEIRAYLSEGRHWLEGTLAATPNAPAALRAPALLAACTLATNLGDYAQAQVLGEDALALWRAQGDPAGIADALNRLGALAYFHGDYAQAHHFYHASLALRRQVGDKTSIAISLNNLGVLANNQTDYAQGAAYYAEALALYRELGDIQRLAGALNNLGIIRMHQGAYAEATALYTESLELRRQLGDKRGRALALGNLGEVARFEADYARAAALTRASLQMRREVADRWGVATALYGLGEIARVTGDAQEALALLEESLQQRQELGDKRGIALTLRSLAWLAIGQEAYGWAATLLHEGLGYYRAQDNKLGIVYCLEAGAAIALGQEQPERAATLLGTAATHRATLGTQMPPTEHTDYDPVLAGTRAALDPAAFAAAWAAGAALSLAAAGDLALDV